MYFLQCEGDCEKMRKLDHHKNNLMKVNHTQEFEHVDMDRWLGHGVEDVAVPIGTWLAPPVGGDDEEGEGAVL